VSVTSPAPKSTSDPEDLLGHLAEKLLEAKSRGAPKHLSVQRAIEGGIAAGLLRHGDQLPPEGELAAAFAVSVGTVRQALGRLAAGGVLVREQGRGTFVADEPRPFFTFRDDDWGPVLPVVPRLIGRDVVKEPGPWSRTLGETAKGYIRIRRLFNVDGRFTCYSVFLLRADRFPGMLHLPITEDVRLKSVLGEAFRTPILHARQFVRATAFPREICRLVGAKQGTSGLVVRVVSLTAGDVPVCYQENWIPATDVHLDMGTIERASSEPRAT
jgi:GntR family transcriptional regulator